MERNLEVLSQIMGKIEQDIICAQRPQGDWIDSVSTTSAAIVALSEYASTPEVPFAIRKGIDWIFKKQGVTGTWGRYRYRTKEEEASGEMNFDPDWPHTVYAVWAQVQLGFFVDSIQKGIEWLCERYVSERDKRSFAPDIDLLTIIEMTKNSSHPEYQKIVERVPFSRWEDMEQTILAREAFSLSELKSLYRYIKYLRSRSNVDIVACKALASHIEQTFCPFVLPSEEYPGTLNIQTTALRILLFLCPEHYLTKAEKIVFDLLDIANISRLNIVDGINIYDTIGLILLEKKFKDGNGQLIETTPTETKGAIKEDTNITNKTKILFLGANPSGSRLKLDEEVKKIQTNLKLAKEREKLELHQEWAVTIDTLIQAILDETPNIVHFSGHGKQEGIILQDEKGAPKTVTAESLAILFELFRDTIKCVILNSCYSENQAKAIKLNIPYVIGMKAGIPDKSAISFSTGFYKAIGAGKDIPFAFKLGKTAIELEGVSGKVIPILLYL
jgi:hypothetical protein